MNSGPNSGWTVRGLTAHCGLQIQGIDLAALDAVGYLELGRLVRKHQVVIVRDQYLSDTDFRTTAEQLGELVAHPVLALAGQQQYCDVMRDSVDSPPANDRWHTDFIGLERPPVIGLLRPDELPEVGGDTLFANTAAVLRSFSPIFRSLLESLVAVHDIRVVESELHRAFGADAPALIAQMPPTRHPLVRWIPELEAGALFFGANATAQLLPLAKDESDVVLEQLFARVNDPAFHVRIKWEPDMVVLWDERSTMHRALGDHFPRERQMSRFLAGTELPVPAQMMAVSS